MFKNQTHLYIRKVMKSINFSIILLLSGIICIITYSITGSFMARSFLEAAEKIPVEPWKVPIISITAFIVLAAVIQNNNKKMDKDIHFLLFGTIELILSLVVIRMLEYNDNSIILFITADLLGYWKNTKTRIFFFTALFVFYIITSLEFVSSIMPVVTLSTYLSFYDESTRTFIITIKSILSSFNILLFMFYMVLLIRAQFLEKERMSILNKKLDDANSQLREANRQLEIYAEKIEENAQTRERNRFAREIHDTLGHMLTGIIAGIDACIKLAERSPQETKKQLGVIGNVARKGIKDVRRSVEALRPDALECSDLEMALRQIVEDTQAVSKTKIELDNQAGALHFHQDEEETIYRVIQEGITNSIQHGKASRIQITIKREKDDLIISVEDNGKGCNNLVEGFGLRHMQERVELLTGSLAYQSDGGFTIRAAIPIRWKE